MRDCRKRTKKEQEQRNDPSTENTKPSTSESFVPNPHCQRTNHPPEVGVVPMPQIDPKDSIRNIQQTIEILGKTKEI